MAAAGRARRRAAGLVALFTSVTVGLLSPSSGLADHVGFYGAWGKLSCGNGFVTRTMPQPAFVNAGHFDWMYARTYRYVDQNRGWVQVYPPPGRPDEWAYKRYDQQWIDWNTRRPVTVHELPNAARGYWYTITQVVMDIYSRFPHNETVPYQYCRA